MHLDMNKLFEGFRKNKDYIFFLAIMPVILLIVYSLPHGIKTSYFVLNTTNPNLPSLLLSSYNHSSNEHLLGNLVVYLLLVPFILTLEKQKGRLYATLIFIFIALPIILSLLNILVIPILQNDTGFSGIISGLFGYYLVCVYTYFKEFRKVKTGWELFYSLVGMNLSIVTYNLQSSLNLYSSMTWAFLFSVALTLHAMSSSLGAIKTILKLIKKDAISARHKSRIAYAELYFFAVLAFVFLFGLPIVLPEVIQVVNGAVVNTPVHYLGYVFGLVLPAFVVWTSEKKNYQAKNKNKPKQS